MTFLDGQMSVSSKNLMEISEARDFAFSVPVRSRYAILCSPRSGSTLLSRGLYNSQVAGDPLEYLNPHLLKLARIRYNLPEMGYADFLRRAEHSRTSMNGVFGLQLHYSQLIGVLKKGAGFDLANKFLERFDRFIWIRRRDKIAQAVSYAIAKRTDVWSSEDVGPRSLLAEDVTMQELIRALHLVVSNDLGWQSIVQSSSLNVQTIWYEDMLEDYAEYVRAALFHIGVVPNVLSAVSFPIEKQSSRLNLELRCKLLDFLGCELSSER